MLFNAFTQQYPLSKTVRFELKPIGKTLEYIKAKNFLKKDAALAESYQKIKPILDDYHRDFIGQALKDISLTELSNFQNHYLALKQNKNDNELRKALEKSQEQLRKMIVKQFKKDEKTKALFESLFAKELFGSTKEQGNLVKWIIQKEGKESPKIALIEQFIGFTTYFSGFYENRKNLYSHENKHTAIAYRLIHENLPRFVDNIHTLSHIKNKYADLYQQFNHLDEQVSNSFDDFNIDDLSEIDFYNHLLTQSGITAYNALLGGKTLDNGKKLQGVNEIINLYNQKNKCKVAKLKPLHKQLLSDKQSLSFLPSRFEDDNEVCNAINDFYRGYYEDFTKIQALLNDIQKYDINGIYINQKQLTHISHNIYGHFNLINNALSDYYANQINPEFESKLAKAKTDTARDKLNKEREKFIKSEHSIAVLEQALTQYCQSKDDVEFVSIVDYLSEYFINTDDEKLSLIKDIDNKFSTIKGFIEKEYPIGECTFYKHKKSQDIINLKLFLDSVMTLVHFIKPLAIGNDAGLNEDKSFYGEFTPLYDDLKQFTSLYNKVRDYVSQKSFNVEKYKLNFDNATLLSGWDLNKEKDNFGIILQKNGNYYLAILDKDHKKVFDQAPVANSQDVYQKMVYKLLPGPNKMLPKVFFAKSNIDDYSPSKNILEKYEQGTHKKGELFNLSDCHRLIDFFKESINKHPEWKEFGFVFSDTSSYNDLSDFYKEVEPQGYKVFFTDIDSQYIDNLVEQGKLYLFQIYNKDFSTHSYGNKNLHTLYFKELFSPENLQNVIYKLNGEAEIFYRQASLNINDVAKHPAGEVLVMKNPNNANVNKIATHTIYKDKRYTQDKFLLHIPITMNFGVDGVGFKAFNQKVNQTLKNSNNDVHIIGIDRGERHLLYVSVINQKGEIIEQKSLNEIVNTGHNGIELAVNYHTLLDNKEKGRATARVNWGEIENIKELKQGYLSQVVHHISQLMLKYNAIVVLEDLNFGFKRGRFKVEKQVYQNFENALIKKLNYLVFKDKTPNELGGIRNALQLTNKFEDIKDIGKQTGFLFYVPAWNTSKIDPTTGFVNLLPLHYENIDKSKDFFAKFDSIFYNANKDYFEFALDYKKFTDKATGSKTDWVICSHGDVRFAYNNTTKSMEKINVNDCLKALFEKHQINYQSGNDLIDLICQNNSKDLYSSLYYYLKVLVSMRYSNANTDDDFILSPVANKNSEFFDSRKIEALPEKERKLPENSDANGAYHIAKKGLWVLKQIKANDNLDKLNLMISNQEWLKFVQNN
ncbi:type V CRISPR-associated protein Cas12a/Cpf1 [Moraxella sp. Tifton1]|uniref:type V CRISPR-associated protein Cas12a/Cpf1 n=1 Tax=Moraxella oculi TaxID=2940516 RepID=UPI002012E162|nr:type V CRISPR-associated protein Cas12a/Cpf1 [Moraxella sp. Tifton1]MCL1624277.1 type V CRISPR-associated protein Cas12a/Cpf1 [Moraxella sp. Tifton1]